MLDLYCDHALNYFVRIWLVGTCVDVPVRSAQSGLNLIAFLQRDETED